MKTLTRTLFAVALAWIGAVHASAAVLPLTGYDHVYDPTTGQLPNAVATPWELSGADPISSVTGEIATTSFSSAGFWQRTNTTHGLNLDKSVGYTIDFRVAVPASAGTNTPFDAFFREIGGGLVELRLRSDASDNLIMTVQEEAGGTRASGTVVTGAGFHTYRFARLANNFSIYVDDNATAVLTGTITNNFSPTSEQFAFGDAGGAISGTADIDWIALDTDGAVFAAPGVPEPASLALMLVGGLLVARRRC